MDINSSIHCNNEEKQKTKKEGKEMKERDRNTTKEGNKLRSILSFDLLRHLQQVKQKFKEKQSYHQVEQQHEGDGDEQLNKTKTKNKWTQNTKQPDEMDSGVDVSNLGDATTGIHNSYLITLFSLSCFFLESQ